MTDEKKSDEMSTSAPILEPSKSAMPKTRVAAAPKKTVRIIIEESEDIPPTGLYLGHNGRGYLLQTGRPIDAPPELVEILDHAVMSTPQLDPVTKTIVGYRDRLRYPYRRVQDGS